MKAERGSVLVHVLVMGLLGLSICAAIMQSRMQPAVTTANFVNRIKDDLSEQSAINRVTEVWARQDSCSSDASVGVGCSGSGCDCSCTVTGAAGVSSLSSGGACVLSARP